MSKPKKNSKKYLANFFGRYSYNFSEIRCYIYRFDYNVVQQNQINIPNSLHPNKIMDIDSNNCYSENYLCDLCDGEFTDISKLVSHSINKHGIPKDEISYDCANCYQSFSISSKFQQHIVKKDNTNFENESKKIEEDTNYADQYYSSEEESINDLGHKCHECSTIFPFESYLEKHINAVHHIHSKHKGNIDVEYLDSYSNKKTYNIKDYSSNAPKEITNIEVIDNKVDKIIEILNKYELKEKNQDFNEISLDRGMKDNQLELGYSERKVSEIDEKVDEMIEILNGYDTKEKSIKSYEITPEKGMKKNQLEQKKDEIVTDKLSDDVSETIMINDIIFIEQNKDEMKVKKNPKKELRNNEKVHKCGICDQSFSTARHLKKHINDVHEGPNVQLLGKEPEVYQRRQHSEKYEFKKNPKFNCELCNKPQTSASNLKRHIYTVHEGHKDNKCESCGKEFSRTQSLKIHIYTVHEGHKDYKCQSCGKSFSTEHYLKTHMLIVHEGIKKHKCAQCNKSFGQSNSLKYHVNKNHDGEKFSCEYCDKIFFANQWLVKHINSVHQNLKTHTCHLCGKTFGDAYQLKKHIKSSVHEGKRDRQCELCGKYFTGQKNLNSHMKFIHSERERNHPCELCIWTFCDARSLKNHIKVVHENPNPRSKNRSKQCESCGKVFTLPVHLRNHIQFVHEGLRKYSCDSCDKKYGSREGLSRHINVIHKGIKKYNCESCDKTFVKKIYLINHQDSIHNGVVRHICELCNKSFYSKTNKKFHIDTVHKRLKNHKCQLCEKTFTAKPFLTYHTDKVHKGQKSN